MSLKNSSCWPAKFCNAPSKFSARPVKRILQSLNNKIDSKQEVNFCVKVAFNKIYKNNYIYLESKKLLISESNFFYCIKSKTNLKQGTT